LPKQINCFSNPSKTNYVQKVPNDTQHGHVSSNTDAGAYKKVSARGISSKLRKMYRDLSHRQRASSTDPKRNRAKNAGECKFKGPVSSMLQAEQPEQSYKKIVMS
jgi:hypothetical protein